MHAWILALMLALQPKAPWSQTYEETAKAIATVVEAETPLFDGEKAREKTAALLVALAFTESRFDAKAVGDHGQSVGLYQIFSPNLPTPEGYGRNEILGHPLEATRVAHRMMRESMRVCARHPVEERLAWYASGDGNCIRGQSESRYRVGIAMRIFKKIPPPNPPQPALAAPPGPAMASAAAP